MGRLRFRLRAVYDELKRRRVLRTVLAYGAVAWVVMQVAETTFEPLGVPEWGVTFVMVLALLGFPVTAVLAWMFQLKPEEAGPADRPEARPGSPAGGAAAPQGSRARVASTLPAPSTPLVGRERELADAERLIVEEGCRFLTVVGSGGIGKTRLAVELGRRLAPRFANGARLAFVGRVRDPAALPAALAEALGLDLSPADDPQSMVREYLRAKRLLLVVDNFEQVTSGSGVLAELVDAAPELTLVVTSRERLGVRAETVLRLGGLLVPSAGAGEDRIPTFDSVRLFLQSARRADHGFELQPGSAADVARICRLVDGVPLALELAGACVAVLSPAEIARQIEERHDVPAGAARDAPERHRSLRAAFESSWEMLEPREREVFRRLSTLRGGFDLSEAEAVAEATLPVLVALANKSLLRRQGSGRLETLEILRQFGEEKLRQDPAEEHAVRDLHCEHFTRLLEDLVGRAPAEAAGALNAAATKADDLRAAWSWAVSRRDYPRLGRAAPGLFAVWDARGWAREALDTFAPAVEAVRAAAAAGGPAAAARKPLLGTLLARQGAFAAQLGSNEEARALLEEARSLLDVEEHAAEAAFTANALGFVARASGEFERGLALARESLEVYRRLGRPAGIAEALNMMGVHAYMLGDYAEARRLWAESAASYRGIGDVRGIWKPLNNLAGIAIAEHEYAEASRLLEENLRHQRELENQRGIVIALTNLGLVAYRTGLNDQAQRLLQEAVGICEEMGFRTHLAQALSTLGNVHAARGERSAALAACQRALDTACGLGDLPMALEVLLGLARLHAAADQQEQAIRLLQLALSHPACDEDTRREAEPLLERLGGRPAGGAEPTPIPDAAGLRSAVEDVLGAVASPVRPPS